MKNSFTVFQRMIQKKIKKNIPKMKKLEMENQDQIRKNQILIIKMLWQLI